VTMWYIEGIQGFISLTLMRGCDDWVQACEIVDNIFNLDPVFRKDVAPEVLSAVAEAEKKETILSLILPGT